jgi:hypothetical protein
MTDRHDAPEGADDIDDAEELRVLRDLGLETLAGGRRPSLADWADIERRAAQVGARRRRVLSAAAALVLLAGLVGGVAIARGGVEGDGVTDAGPAAAQDLYVLPPEDAVIVGVVTGLDAVYVDGRAALAEGKAFLYSVRYAGPDGTPLYLSAGRLADPWTGAPVAYQQSGSTTPTTGPPVDGPLADAGYPVGWPAVPVPLDDVGPAALTCLGARTSPRPPDSSDDTGAREPSGPIGVVLTAGTWMVSLAPVDDELGRTCTVDASTRSPAVAAAQELRLVGLDEWLAFVDRHGSTPLPDPEGSSRPPGTRFVPPPTSMPAPTPTVSIPDEASARQQVVDAFAGLQERAADGTFPNLEGGVVDGDAYAGMIEQAATNARAMNPGRFEATDVRFTSDSTAEVQFRADASLASGPVSVRFTGQAVRLDDRWVVSRDTFLRLVGRSDLVGRTGG